MTKKILAIPGSIRDASYNRYLLKAAQQLAPSDIIIELFEIGSLPMFDQDLEAEFPATAIKLKEAIEAADGILIATPEYNRSIPGVLKNAIDWASRPYGKNSFAGKPVLIIGATPGNLGTALAQYHLKQIMLCLDTRVIGQPEFYVSESYKKFAEDGTLTDDDTKTHLKKALDVLIRNL